MKSNRISHKTKAMSKPTPTRNRQPTPAERSGLIAQIDRDTKLLEYLQEDLASRLAIQAEAATSLEKATITLSEARMRLKATTAQRDSLINSLKNLKQIFDEIELPKNKSKSDTPNSAPPQSPHTAATATAIVRQQDLITLLETALQEAKYDVRTAAEAAIISEEDFKCATNLHDASRNLIPLLRGKIDQISKTISLYKIPIQSIWRVPDNVWADIFSLVVHSNEDNTDIQPPTIPAMIISEVCYQWRSIVRSQKALWPLSQPKTWNSITSLVIPSQTVNYYRIVTSRFDWLASLSTLELYGNTVDAVLPSFSTKMKDQEAEKPRVPSLTKLILSAYDGDGKVILSWAENRHLTLLGISNWKTVEATESKYIDSSRKSAPGEATAFVEYCCRRLALGLPTINNFPVTVNSAYYRLLIGQLVVAHYSQPVTPSDADPANRLYFEAARRFRGHNQTLWTDFLQFRKKGGSSPDSETFFKIELKNCNKIDPSILQKLTTFRK